MDPHAPSPRTSRLRNRVGAALLAAALLFLAGAIAVALWVDAPSPGEAETPQQLARGAVLYAEHCAACHGARLEGQPNWQEKLPNGRMPAPPHDASGHTWHHPDEVLFGIVKHGLVPGLYAPPGYESDMPAFGDRLSDEDIRAVLAYIRSHWPEEIRRAQRTITEESRRRRAAAGR